MPNVSYIQSLVPLNIQTEKEKFLFDNKYNPQFEYAEQTSSEKFGQYGKVEHELFPFAENILNKVIKNFGTESNFLRSTEGIVIPEDEVDNRIRFYLEKNNVLNKVDIVKSRKFVARTSLEKVENRFILKIRLPVDYREHTLEKVLNHEIGTHLFRWLNEEKQPWNGRRNSFKFAPYLESEEGLASLNALFEHESPYLWVQSLYYYSVCLAERLSYSELFKELGRYIEDKERRWKFCLRVKRGLSDTSQPGAFSKDQLYLKGIFSVTKWMIENPHQVQYLYFGKISLEDIARVEAVANKELILPEFLLDNKKYLSEIRRIISFNKISFPN